jgi:hypothetical protein
MSLTVLLISFEGLRQVGVDPVHKGCGEHLGEFLWCAAASPCEYH